MVPAAYAGSPLFNSLNHDNYQNQVANSVWSGASAGSPGSPGTYWSLQSQNGLNPSISAIGTENGLPYVDVTVNGTPSAASFVGIVSAIPSPTNGVNLAFIPAAVNDWWTVSGYLKLVSGTLPGGAVVQLGYNISNGASYLGTNAASYSITSSSLITQRYGAAYKITQGTATFIAPSFVIYVPASTAINVTIRVAGIQLEKGSARTAYDATTPMSAALTAGTSTWSVPSTFNRPNEVFLVGAGGSGSGRQSASVGGNGGGGGEFVSKRNISLIAGRTINVSIPAGGAGTDTSFNSGAITAKSGGNATTAAGGAGGSGGVGGTSHFDGGAGFTTTGGTGGGGGGAAGWSGAGVSSTSSNGGQANPPWGVPGEAGGIAGLAGSELDGTNGFGSGASGAITGSGSPGGSYGGGGGGSDTGAASVGGAGAPGLIFITYTKHTGGAH